MTISRSIVIFIPTLLLLGACHKKSSDQTVTTISTPLVTTAAVKNITNSSALCGGSVTDASNGNVVSRGICWSINQFPAIDDVNDFKAAAGAGLGDFSATMTNLLPNKTYYVRAYATNEEGTGYGNDVVFTTSPFVSFMYNISTIYVYPTDNGVSVWGTSGVVTAATSTNSGSDNTAYISNQSGNYAAKICADLVAYGYSDWYLPSSDELNVMYQNKVLVGNLANQEYWSSTETSSTTAASQNFQNGTQSTDQVKNQLKYCRCVRKD